MYPRRAASTHTKSSPSVSSKCEGKQANLIRDDNFWQLGPRAIEDRHVADPVHERAARALDQVREERIPGLTIPAGCLDLDELVIGERTVSLAGDRFRQSARAQPNDRLQSVGEAAKMAPLALRKRRSG